MSDPKILVIDIETAPLELYGWKLFDENFSLDQIKTDWTILSFAAKWLGKKKIIYADTGGRGVKKVRDDKPLMGKLWKLIDEADIIIAQNGKKFDARKIRARLIARGFGPPSPFRIIDTMITARRLFAFTSQKLKYTSKLLSKHWTKDEHKEFPDFTLWAEVLKDNPRAWKAMKKYNIQDILATEEVYLAMRAWDDQHPNMGTYSAVEKPICPHCGSEKVIGRNGWREVKNQGVYKRLFCNDCHGWSRGKIMLNPIKKRRSQLAY
jgi:DNA polymerase elongation subunit (family B)